MVIVVQKARIKFTSTDYNRLNNLCKTVIEIAGRTGVKYAGPIPLPTRKLIVPTRKGFSGGGTESYEHWQLRIHKRIIDIESDERTLRRVMRVEIPEDVNVEIELIETS